MQDLFTWMGAIVKKWAGYSTGGVAVAVVGLYFGSQEKTIPSAIFLTLSAIFFLTAFFKEWHEQFQRVKSLKSLLESEKSTQTAKIIEMQSQILELKRKLGDRQQEEIRALETKITKEKLGEYRIRLKNRVAAINKLSPDEYERTRNGDIDKESNDLVNEIAECVQRNVGQNAYVEFVDKAGMDRTGILHYYGRSIFDEDWQSVQHQLKHYEKNLGRIAANLPS